MMWWNGAAMTRSLGISNMVEWRRNGKTRINAILFSTPKYSLAVVWILWIWKFCGEQVYTKLTPLKLFAVH